MVTKRQEQLEKIKGEIAGILKERSKGDQKKAKEIFKQLGLGKFKDLTLDKASLALEKLKIDQKETLGNDKGKEKQGKKLEVAKGEEIEQDLLPVPFGTASGPLAIITEKFVDRAVAIMDKVNTLAVAKLKQMRATDFVIFGDVVCLRGGGIDKFLTGLFLPVELKNVKELPQEKTPNGYPLFRFQGEAVNIITGMTIPIYSEESSEKKFYCQRRTKDGKPYKLPPEQVNLRDVRVAGHRGLRKELVKCFFGLRGMSIEEAESRGVDTKSIFRVPFKGG